MQTKTMPEKKSILARPLLSRIAAEAASQKIEIYVVGGFVRDLLLGNEGPDIDLVVFGDSIAFAKRLQSVLGGSKVVAYPRFETAMFDCQSYRLELVGARPAWDAPDSAPTLDTDLRRRDFTINAMAMAIGDADFGRILDPLNGAGDLEAGLIRTAAAPEQTFGDDPLRMLRAVRFAAQLDFQIEASVLDAIKSMAPEIQKAAQERITAEFQKLMMVPQPSTGLNLFRKSGLSEAIFPELDQLAGVEQRGEYFHKDVFHHSLKVVDNISPYTDNFALRLVALMHDIAKPQTKRFTPGHGWTFHGHEELGARMVDRIGRRMKLPRKTIEYVAKLVRLHMRPTQLSDDSVTDSAVRRLMVEAGEDIEDLMTLCRADITSKNPRRVERYLANFDYVEKRIGEVEEKDELRNFKPAITGNEIMANLGMPPGPIIGEIKQRITDAILDGEIPNEREACLDFFLKIRDEMIAHHRSDSDGSGKNAKKIR